LDQKYENILPNFTIYIKDCSRGIIKNREGETKMNEQAVNNENFVIEVNNEENVEKPKVSDKSPRFDAVRIGAWIGGLLVGFLGLVIRFCHGIVKSMTEARAEHFGVKYLVWYLINMTIFAGLSYCIVYAVAGSLQTQSNAMLNRELLSAGLIDGKVCVIKDRWGSFSEKYTSKPLSEAKIVSLYKEGAQIFVDDGDGVLSPYTPSWLEWGSRMINKLAIWRVYQLKLE